MNLKQLKEITPYNGKTQTALRVVVLFSAGLGIWVLRGDGYLPLRTIIMIGIKCSFLVNIGFFSATFRIKYPVIRYLLALYLIPGSLGVAYIMWHIHGAFAYAAIGLHCWLIFKTIFYDKALFHEASKYVEIRGTR